MYCMGQIYTKKLFISSLDLTGYPVFYFKNILFIHLRERERERETARAHEWVGWGAEGEADSPLSREPNGGLDLRILGSLPELKSDT